MFCDSFVLQYFKKRQCFSQIKDEVTQESKKVIKDEYGTGNIDIDHAVDLVQQKVSFLQKDGKISAEVYRDSHRRCSLKKGVRTPILQSICERLLLGLVKEKLRQVVPMIHFISQYFAAVTAEYWKHGKTHFCLMFPFYIP